MNDFRSQFSCRGAAPERGLHVAHAMRIALVSTCAVSVPPLAYGGTELVVAALAEALVARGHEVIVYATGDSRPAGTLRYHFSRAVWPPDAAAERRHAAWAWRDARALGAEVAHVNSPEALLEWDGALPTVATIHHAFDENLREHYAQFQNARLVAISRRQAELAPALDGVAVVHHGLDPADYPAGRGGGGYCAFLGRIAAEKAPHLAIDAARQANLPLVIGAPRRDGDPDYDAYYEHELRSRLDWPGVRWPGEMDHRGKLELLGNAEALLMPLGWDEPFGLVMIEAMLVGTPVIAFRRGSAPEVVEDGITGFVVDDWEAMARALPAARALDRAACRRRAQSRFSAARMAAEYEALYRDVIVACSTPLDAA
jgi:glycosyltransferase involved in cell wall biosynthesis